MPHCMATYGHVLQQKEQLKTKLLTVVENLISWITFPIALERFQLFIPTCYQVLDSQKFCVHSMFPEVVCTSVRDVLHVVEQICFLHDRYFFLNVQNPPIMLDIA